MLRAIMRPFGPSDLRRVALAAGAALLFCAAAARGVTSAEMTPERYAEILNRAPFGPPPPPPPTPDELATNDVSVVEEPAPSPYVIPPGLDKIKVTLISRYRGTPAVGFLDGTSNKSYYLMQGEEFDGIACRAIDLSDGFVTLEKDGLSAELPIWINPATTNRADVTTYGQPGGAPVDLSQLPQVTDWEAEQARSAARREMEERREARRRAREEFEERRRKHSEEMAALTPEQRERRMHDINVDIIINGSGPPLPIELDDEDLRRLEAAGFEIPSEEERAAAREAAQQRRGPGRRGGWGGGEGRRGPPRRGAEEGR